MHVHIVNAEDEDSVEVVVDPGFGEDERELSIDADERAKVTFRPVVKSSVDASSAPRDGGEVWSEVNFVGYTIRPIQPGL